MAINLIVNVVDHAGFLQQILPHYFHLGVDRIIVNFCFRNNHQRQTEECLKMMRGYSCIVANNVPFDGTWVQLATLINQARQRYAQEHDWVLYADLDELHSFPRDLVSFLRICESSNKDVVCGEFVDRIASDGSLPKLSFDQNLFTQFPVGSRLSVQLLKVPRWRTVAARGYVQINKHWDTAADLGFCPDSTLGRTRIHDEIVTIHHFKWHSSVLSRMKGRYVQYRDLFSRGDNRFDHYTESERCLQILTEDGSRFTPELIDVLQRV